LTGLFGVHGESLGGSITPYIGQQLNADFIFADRTFSNFTEVAWGMMGNIGILGVKLFTFWREHSEIEYVGYKGYKVIGSDPND